MGIGGGGGRIAPASAAGVAVAVAAMAGFVGTLGCGSGSGPGDVDAGGVDAAVAPACGVPSGETVMHMGNVSADETWAGDGVTHAVPSNLQIGAGTVTIEACAIVSVGPGVSITVRGSANGGEAAALVAAGTGSDRFVLFTRAEADEAWGILRGYDAGSRIELHHAVLRGGGEFGGQYRNAAIAMTGAGYADLPVELLEVDNVLVEDPVGVGVYFDTNAAFTADSTQLAIRGAADHPLVMGMMSLGTIPDGDYSGNARDDVLVAGQFNVFGDLTIRKRLPVRIQVGQMSVAAPVNDTFPVTLTLEPGVELRFQPLAAGPGARVTFGSNGNAPNNKVGVLDAQGTANEPIRFTSGAEPPAAGDWVGLWLDTAPGSRLDNVIIEYAGGDSGISSSNCRPEEVTDDAALIIGDFSDQFVPPPDLVTNTTIRASAGSAINAVWVGPAIGPSFVGTGGNSLSDFAECAQTYNSVDGPEACPMVGCF
jgi:hypothetical protein